MAALQLEVVTPNGPVVQAEADYVGIPGELGQLGIMPGHSPLLTALVPGRLYFRKNDQNTDVFISGGFAEISENRVSILAESAELKEQIDVARAQRAMDRAKQRLHSASTDDTIDVVRAEAALLRASLRMKIASGS